MGSAFQKVVEFTSLDSFDATRDYFVSGYSSSLKTNLYSKDFAIDLVNINKAGSRILSPNNWPCKIIRIFRMGSNCRWLAIWLSMQTKSATTGEESQFLALTMTSSRAVKLNGRTGTNLASACELIITTAPHMFTLCSVQLTPRVYIYY